MLSRGTWIATAPDSIKAIPPNTATEVVTRSPRSNATVARPPRANPNTVTQVLHEYGRSARAIASGKYGPPSPPAVNVCPSPWYGFQSGRSPFRRYALSRAWNGTITTDDPHDSAVMGIAGRR